MLDQILNCTECSLCSNRTTLIDKVENDSKVCFVLSHLRGDISKVEELKSELFVPASTLFLLKCPANKFILESFIPCHFHIEEQLKQIKPKVIVVFGEDTFKAFTGEIDTANGVLKPNNVYFSSLINKFKCFKIENSKGYLLPTFDVNDPRLNVEQLTDLILDKL